MEEVTSLFPESYESSRDRFREWEKKVASRWPGATLQSHAIGDSQDDLGIDVLLAPATRKNDHLFLMTTGEHGIEGYVGSAMLEFFLQKFLSGLDPSSTALCLVHPINPWGMKHRQRTNAQNVDLNRNFIEEWAPLEKRALAYSAFDELLSPRGPVRHPRMEALSFVVKILKEVLIRGKKAQFKEALLAGQYSYPRGLYYGGEGPQPETIVMEQIFRQCFDLCRHIVHIDIHTGYGPRYQMSVVNSPLAEISSREQSARLGYPRVVSTVADEFYRMEGDMLDYPYLLRKKEYPAHRLYSTCFEFGCFGDSLFAQLKSLWALVSNNRTWWFGHEGDVSSLRHLWQESYFPSETAWRRKAIDDFRQATLSILREQGIEVKEGIEPPKI